jgi:hypothetical protein
MKRYIRQLASLVSVLGLVLVPLQTASAANMGATLVSLGNGNTTPDNRTTGGDISADGRYVVFNSAASNVVPGYTPQVVNGSTLDQVFVHDRQTGTTQLVSVNAAGQPADAGVGSPYISGNGRYVLFNTNAQNLTASDPGSQMSCYIRDLQTNTTSKVLPANPVTGYNACWGISYDGNVLGISGSRSYTWPSYNCPSFPCNWDNSAGYVLNRSANTLEPVAVASDGTYGSVNGSVWYNYHSYRPTMSDDGNMIAFSSVDPLTPGTTYGKNKQYVRNISTGSVQLVQASGEAADNWNSYGTISGDGTKDVYSSLSADGSHFRLFVRDLTTGSDTQITLPSGSYLYADAHTNTDGSIIVYGASPQFQTSLNARVYAYNTRTNLTTMLDKNTSGDTENGSAYAFRVLADGSTLFDTDATNLSAATTPQLYLSAPVIPPAPIVNITNPSANSTLTGTVNISGSITSASNYSLMLYVFDSSSHAVVSKYQYNVPVANTTSSYSWDTTGVPNGNYTIVLSAKDSAGHKNTDSTATIHVTVQN